MVCSNNVHNPIIMRVITIVGHHLQAYILDDLCFISLCYCLNCLAYLACRVIIRHVEKKVVMHVNGIKILYFNVEYQSVHRIEVLRTIPLGAVRYVLKIDKK